MNQGAPSFEKIKTFLEKCELLNVLQDFMTHKIHDGIFIHLTSDQIDQFLKCTGLSLGETFHFKNTFESFFKEDSKIDREIDELQVKLSQHSVNEDDEESEKFSDIVEETQETLDKLETTDQIQQNTSVDGSSAHFDRSNSNSPAPDPLNPDSPQALPPTSDELEDGSLSIATPTIQSTRARTFISDRASKSRKKSSETTEKSQETPEKGSPSDRAKQITSVAGSSSEPDHSNPDSPPSHALNPDSSQCDPQDDPTTSDEVDDGGLLLAAPIINSTRAETSISNRVRKRKNSLRPSVNAEEITEKRRRYNDTLAAVVNLNLYEFLDGCLDGRGILSVYEKDGFLGDDEVKLLAEVLAKWLLYQTVYPTPYEYKCISDKIITVFKGVNIWYHEAQTNGRIYTAPYGKLFNKVKNVRDWMRKKYLLPPKKGSDDEDEEDSYEVDLLHSLMTKALENESLKKSLTFLLKYLEPWPLIIKHWMNSREFRLKYESKSDSPLTIGDYTNKYKAIRLERGHELISIDFDYFHENKGGLMALKWPAFEESLIKYINKSKKRIYDATGKQLLREFQSDESEIQENGRRVLLLQLLASLLPVKRKIKIGNKQTKPSIELSRNSFIYHITVAGQVASTISARHKAAHGLQATVQPYILFVGANRWTVDAVYVIIDDFFYKFGTVLEAVAACFQCFFVLNAKYPPESEHLWFLLQKEIYDVTTDEDAQQLDIQDFIQRLKSL